MAGFPIAVVYKLSDDRGPYLAALITYYGFMSLFPLLLLFVTAAGFFLDGAPAFRQRIITLILQAFPAIGPQLGDSISGFHGSGAALAIGIAGSLYGGLGAMQAAQLGFNTIYGVPRNEQPNPFSSRLRSLGLVVLFGMVVLASTGLATLVSTATGFAAEFGPGRQVLGYLLAFAINIALFTGAFQLLTARELRIRDVLTGGFIAGLLWEIVQIFGARYVAHEMSHGTLLYGVFGVVLAAIAWIYLQSLALVVAAEVNVVLHHRLWPRALLAPFTDEAVLTEADRQVYLMSAVTQQFKGFASVRVDFSETSSRPG